MEHIAHQAVTARQVPRELLDELLEACSPLRPRSLLMRLRYGSSHGELMADEERDGLDQDSLIAFQAIELVRELAQPPRCHHLAPIGTVR